MRYVTIDEDFAAQELAREMLAAGVSGDLSLQAIADGRINPDADENVNLDFQMDREELVEHASASTLQEALNDLGIGGDERDLEAAVRYSRDGECRLAEAMFARVINPVLMPAVERALAS